MSTDVSGLEYLLRSIGASLVDIAESLRILAQEAAIRMDNERERTKAWNDAIRAGAAEDLHRELEDLATPPSQPGVYKAPERD